MGRMRCAGGRQWRPPIAYASASAGSLINGINGLTCFGNRSLAGSMSTGNCAGSSV